MITNRSQQFYEDWNKAVVKIAAIEIPANEIVEIETVECILPFKCLAL